MSVIANVAINVDSRSAGQKLREIAERSKKVETAVNGMSSSLNKNNSVLDKNAASSAKLANNYKNLDANAKKAKRTLSGLQQILISLGAAAALKKSFADAQALAIAQKRLKRVTLEFGQFAGAQKEAERLATQFEVSVTDTAGALASLGSRLGSQGRDLQDIVTVYEGLNSALIVTGKSAEEARAVSYQLAQALGSGKLTGDEFRTVSEALPELLTEVAKAAGISTMQIKEFAKEGGITADVVIAATKRLRDKYGADLQANITDTQRFQNALGGLSETIGTEVSPAITTLLKGGTQLLKLFGQLPGPVKTVIAAVFGLSAAFVVLAPAISTIIGLLDGLTLATIAAAAPWVALAAGITAAAVALGSYQTASQKQSKIIGAAARGGGAADLAKGRNRIIELQQAISLAEKKQGERTGGAGSRSTNRGGQRSAAGTNLASLKAELAQLKQDVAIGERTANAPITLPTKPLTDEDEDDSKARDKAAQEEQRLQARIRGLQIETEGAKQLALIKGKIAEAEMLGNDELAIRLKGEERNQQILIRYQQALENVTDEREQQALFIKALVDLETAGIETAIDLEKQRLDVIKEQNAEFFKRAGLTPTDKMSGGAGAFDTSLPDLRVSPAEQQMTRMREELQALTNPINIAVNGANAIGDAFAQAFQGIVSGSQTAQEALASAFNAIGQAFVQMAGEIIAKQIAMIAFQAILKALGGGGSFSFGGEGPVAMPGAGVGGGSSMFMPGAPSFRANGGATKMGTPYLVGERGPELFVPGTNGGVMSNSDLRSAMGAAPGSSGGSPVLNMSFESTNIGGVEYVSRDQLEQAMAATRRQAAKDGAKRGMSMTLDRLQQSPQTRRRVGI